MGSSKMQNGLRTLAMYLPQFHRIKENDAWWGAGYTEWTAVKKAESLFPGHLQPNVPLDERYYDLLDKETMQWQAKTAKKYGIAGFCFYHYWFKEDQKVLEKPAENLLQWTDIDMPFCFAWDSGQWARTWTKMGNSWADGFEPERRQDESGNGILLEQNYGDESYWRAHFEYLLPFFQDERYIKVAGKPVFIFYSSTVIPCFQRLVSAWRQWSREAGFPNMYIIAFHVPDACADAVILPMAFTQKTLGYNMSLEHLIEGTSLRGYDYDAVWQDYLQYMPSQMNRTFWLGTVGFDDTPRRGMNGRVYLHATPEKFENYFAKMVDKSLAMENPFVFIDAWNEWGEGKYLEPDKKNKFGYLEAVRNVLNRAEREHKSADGYVFDAWKCQAKKLEKQYLDKLADNQLISAWLKIRSNKQKLVQYLKACGYNSIAIYACGIHGKMLCDDLAATEIQVKYFVDVHKDGLQKTEVIDIYSPEDDLPVCDVMIVSLHRQFYDIYQLMHPKVTMPVISLYEILYEAEKF